MRWFGQPAKAGGARREQPGGLRRGRVIPGNSVIETIVTHSPDRISLAMMASLAIAQATSSPMSNGNGGGVTQNFGAGIVGRDGRRTGPLQNFNNVANPLAQPQSRKVGMQGGPGDQPGGPSTNQPGNPIAGSLEWLAYPGILGK